MIKILEALVLGLIAAAGLRLVMWFAKPSIDAALYERELRLKGKDATKS